jgi:hypothetical protein
MALRQLALIDATVPDLSTLCAGLPETVDRAFLQPGLSGAPSL